MKQSRPDARSISARKPARWNGPAKIRSRQMIKVSAKTADLRFSSAFIRHSADDDEFDAGGMQPLQQSDGFKRAIAWHRAVVRRVGRCG